MSMFNTFLRKRSECKNHEGAEAFRLSPEMELYTAVVTTSLSDKFYETAPERVERIAKLVGKCDARFVAQLAVYARTKMNLRSVPLLLVVELAKRHSGDDLVSRAVNSVVLRADEIMELLMCYQWRNHRSGSKKLGKLSNQIRNGLKMAFNKFDEYQFAKYNRDGLDVKLRDALFIVHPKAENEAQQAIFDKIVSDSLATPYTWETELSALGQTATSPKEKRMAFTAKWEELIRSQRLGYMAILRNLRNILEAEVSAEPLQMALSRIANEQEVMRSKQFPFRYLSAYRELLHIGSGNTSLALDALEAAIVASAVNIQGFDSNTRVLLACDVSGSMISPVSRNSSVTMYDIGLVLAMLLKSRCKNVVSGIFGDTWKVLNLPSSGILSNVEMMRARNGEVGYSTNGHKVIEYLIKNRIKMDKVMMFTDCQMWNSYHGGETLASEWKKYKAICPEAKLYLFDLSGYGTSPVKFIAGDVTLICGWSDRIFEMLSAIENGSTVIEEIRKIAL